MTALTLDRGVLPRPSFAEDEDVPVRLALLSVLLLGTACIPGLRRVTRTVLVDEQVVSVRRELVPGDEPYLSVEGARLDGATLRAKLRVVADCRVRTERRIEARLRRETVLVDAEGRTQDPGQGAEMLLTGGFAAPLIAPLVYLWLAAESGSQPADDGFAVSTAAGGVVGTGLLVAGAVASLSTVGTGVHGDLPSQTRIEERLEGWQRCLDRPVEDQGGAAVWVGTSSAPARLERGGELEADLRPLTAVIAEDFTRPWELRLPDGQSAAVPIPVDERRGLLGYGSGTSCSRSGSASVCR